MPDDSAAFELNVYLCFGNEYWETLTKWRGCRLADDWFKIGSPPSLMNPPLPQIHYLMKGVDLRNIRDFSKLIFRFFRLHTHQSIGLFAIFLDEKTSFMRIQVHFLLPALKWERLFCLFKKLNIGNKQDFVNNVLYSSPNSGATYM